MTASQRWWLKPEVSVLKRLRQGDHKFKANLAYKIRSKPGKPNYLKMKK